MSPDQKASVHLAIDTGRFRREEDAVEEAMLLWEERERRRLEILTAVEKADASMADSMPDSLQRMSEFRLSP